MKDSHQRDGEMTTRAYDERRSNGDEGCFFSPLLLKNMGRRRLALEGFK
jgi:hypothetical protein